MDSRRKHRTADTVAAEAMARANKQAELHALVREALGLAAPNRWTGDVDREARSMAVWLYRAGVRAPGGKR